jgi:hypothetical protein
MSTILGGLPLYEPLFQLMCHAVPAKVKAATHRCARTRDWRCVRRRFGGVGGRGGWGVHERRVCVCVCVCVCTARGSARWQALLGVPACAADRAPRTQRRCLAAMGRFKELAPRLLERLVQAAIVSPIATAPGAGARTRAGCSCCPRSMRCGRCVLALPSPARERWRTLAHGSCRRPRTAAEFTAAWHSRCCCCAGVQASSATTCSSNSTRWSRGRCAGEQRLLQRPAACALHQARWLHACPVSTHTSTQHALPAAPPQPVFGVTGGLLGNTGLPAAGQRAADHARPAGPACRRRGCCALHQLCAAARGGRAVAARVQVRVRGGGLGRGDAPACRAAGGSTT